MLLGCIGDDFTGSSDLANTLAKEGMRVVQYTGVPDGPADAEVQPSSITRLPARSALRSEHRPWQPPHHPRAQAPCQQPPETAARPRP